MVDSQRDLSKPDHPSLFVPADGTAPARVADRYEDLPPAVPIVGTYVAGWAALSAVFTIVGLLLTKVVLDGTLGNRDAEINRWLAERRTSWVNSVTSVATFLADTLPVITVVAVSCLVLVLLRHWREAVFLAGALLLEVTVFLTANTLADRARPDVPRLDSTPSTGSFPSGHAAATLALWVGLAIIVSANVRNRLVRAFVWIVATVLALLAAFSRVYRGMHHVTDVIAGLALGLGSLAVALFAVRVVSGLVAHREERSARSAPPLPSTRTSEVAP